MSSYKRETKHPIGGHWELADWIDDKFGKHKYGVYFPSTEETFDADDFAWQTRENQHEYNPDSPYKLKVKNGVQLETLPVLHCQIVLAFIENIQHLTYEERATLLKTIQIINHPVYVV